MRDSADAVIVGAGVIGSALALELSEQGYRTLNIDKPGSRIRPEQQLVCDCPGALLNPRGRRARLGQLRLLGALGRLPRRPRRARICRFVQCGTVLLKGASNGGGEAHTTHWQKVRSHYGAQGIPFEEWTSDSSQQMRA